MKTFKELVIEMGGGGMGGGAPATGTAGVAGAGDDKTTVPVFRKKKTSPVMGMVTRKAPV
jgi:hypothetical protein